MIGETLFVQVSPAVPRRPASSLGGGGGGGLGLLLPGGEVRRQEEAGEEVEEDSCTLGVWEGRVDWERRQPP